MQVADMLISAAMPLFPHVHAALLRVRLPQHGFHPTTSYFVSVTLSYSPPGSSRLRARTQPRRRFPAEYYPRIACQLADNCHLTYTASPFYDSKVFQAWPEQLLESGSPASALCCIATLCLVLLLAQRLSAGDARRVTKTIISAGCNSLASSQLLPAPFPVCA